MKIKATYIEEALGTASADPEIHEKFIASKSADKEKVKEEMAATSAEELIEKSLTIWPKDEDGKPFIWDYQVRGFIKSWFQMKTEFTDFKILVGKKKEYKVSKWTYKRIVDNHIFVFPRKIFLTMPENTEITICTRPLRAETQRGERVALASSEAIPEGTTFEFEIRCLVPQLEELIPDILNYGELKGISQWRNSGKGKFTWEEID
jgi:hypothetical protein